MAVVGSARLGSPLDLRSSVQQPARLPHQSAAAARSNGGLSLPSSTSRAVAMVSQPPSSRTSVTSAAAPAAPLLQRTIEDTMPASPLPEEFDGTGPSAAARDIISEMFPDYNADAMCVTTSSTHPLDAAASLNRPSSQPGSGSSCSSSDDTDRPYQAAKQRWESDRLILHVAHAATPSTSSSGSWITTLLSSVRGHPASPRLTPEQQQLIQTAVTAPTQRRRRQRQTWTPSDEAATAAEEGEGEQEFASGGHQPWQGGLNGAAGLQKEVGQDMGAPSASAGARMEVDRAPWTASAASTAPPVSSAGPASASAPSASPATAAAPPQSPSGSDPAAAQASPARPLSAPRQRMGAPGVAPELSHRRRQSLDQLMGILDGVGMEAAPRGLPVNMPRSVQQLLFRQELRQQEGTRRREQAPLWPQAEGQGQRRGQAGDDHLQSEAQEQGQEQGQGQGHPGAGQGGFGSSLSPSASISQPVSQSVSRPSPTSTNSSSGGGADIAGPSSGSGVEERWSAGLSPAAPGAEHGKGKKSALISAGPDMVLSVASTGVQATARRSSSSGSDASGNGSSGSGRSGSDGGVARGSGERESVGRVVGSASVENLPINPSRDSMDPLAPLALASISDSSDDETEGAGHGLEGTRSGPREVGFDAAGTGGASTSGGGSATDGAGAGYGAARGGQGSYYRLRSGARGYFLQHASWLLERNPDLQSFPANPSPRQQGALAKMNKLLVEHAMSPSSTWTDVCRAVRDYGDWMDPISLSCMLQVLARKGPTPWRLGHHWAAQNGFGAASHQRPFLPVLEPSLGQKRDQQLLRRTLSQLLRMISGRADQFPSQAAASSLHALSLLTTRHEAPVIPSTQPPTAPGSSSAAPSIPTALFNPQRRSASIDALCSALLLRLSEPHTRPTPRALAVALYACARMGVGPPGVSLGPLLKVVCAMPLERFSTREFVTVGAALVQLSQFPSLAWMQSYEREAIRRMGEVSSSDLLLLLKATVTYWAAQPPQTQGQRQPLPSREYMNSLLAALFVVLPQFQPYQIAGVMVCLAHMGYTPSSAWLGKLQVQVVRTCFAFSPKELSLVLGALARLKPQSPLYWDPSYESGHTNQQRQGQTQGQGQGQRQGQGQQEKQRMQGQGSSVSSSADGARGADVTDTSGSAAAQTTLQQLLASMGLTRERPGMLAGDRAAQGSPQASPHRDQRHQQASAQHRPANGQPLQLVQQQQQQQQQQQSLHVQGGCVGYVLLQEEMLVAATGLFAAPHNQRGLGGRTGSRFLGALATLVERLPAADAERARARLAPSLIQMLPTVSRLAAVRAHAVASGPAMRAGGHSATSSTRAAGDIHSWPKRKTAGERQADESAKEVSLDLFQTIQMTVALLNLVGRQLPPGFMRTMEHAMVVQLQQEQEAPHSMRPAPSSSWRELAAAYERAGLAAGSPELARLMLLLA